MEVQYYVVNTRGPKCCSHKTLKHLDNTHDVMDTFRSMRNTQSGDATHADGSWGLPLVLARQEEAHRVLARQEEAHRVLARQEEAHRVLARQEEAHWVLARQEEAHWVLARQEEAHRVLAHQEEAHRVLLSCRAELEAPPPQLLGLERSEERKLTKDVDAVDVSCNRDTEVSGVAPPH